jgi:hypothetical protein
MGVRPQHNVARQHAIPEISDTLRALRAISITIIRDLLELACYLY